MNKHAYICISYERMYCEPTFTNVPKNLSAPECLILLLFAISVSADGSDNICNVTYLGCPELYSGFAFDKCGSNL